MAMFACHVLTRETLGAMESIANGVALGIRRKRIEEERGQLQREIIVAQEARLAELSTPLLPLGRDILIMPLIGTVDEARARQVIDAASQGVVAHGARFVLIDITGVPTVDDRVAGAIVQASQMVYLLGAEVVLTGIRAGVAQVLGRLGVDLTQLVTRKTLQSGLEYAEQRLREAERNNVVSRTLCKQTLY
jgi:anti-anti-sigma regulatory factor